MKNNRGASVSSMDATALGGGSHTHTYSIVKNFNVRYTSERYTATSEFLMILVLLRLQHAKKWKMGHSAMCTAHLIFATQLQDARYYY